MEYCATVQTNKTVTHDGIKKDHYAILSRHSKWQKYVKNDAIYVNMVKNKIIHFDT